MKKILHLTLKKKWFDLILEGRKNEEYRIAKPYWVGRLTDKFDLRGKEVLFRHFDEIIFKNGYSDISPTIRIGCQGIEYRLSMYSFDDRLAPTINEPFFAIKLGNILETKNIKSAPKSVANTAYNKPKAGSVSRSK